MPQVRDARGAIALKAGLASRRLPALAFDGRHYYTRSAGGKVSVYGEALRRGEDGAWWRRWDPLRSKVAAALHCGGLTPAVEETLAGGPVLYLGAASGTTLSHMADLVHPAPAFGVEVAARSFSDLLEKLKPWDNVNPVHADARRPEAYKPMVGEARGVVQDVAAPDQVEILAANAREFLRPGSPALLLLKARSVDSAAEPTEIFESARGDLRGRGFEIVEQRSLEPFDRDHRAFFLKWRAP